MSNPSPRRRAVIILPTDEPLTRREGRPDFRPTTAQREQVIAMSAAGVPRESQAVILGIEMETLEKHFPFELHNGHELAKGHVTGRLFRTAVFGEGASAVDAAKFWLSSRAGWKPVAGIEASGPDGTPIQVNAGLSDEERAIRLLQILNKFQHLASVKKGQEE